MDYPGIKESLANHLNCENVNLSQCAGSNPLQVQRIQEYIIRNQVDTSDIVVWQLTGIARMHIRSPFLKGTNSHVVESQPNIFDGRIRYDFLSNSEVVDTPENRKLYDEGVALETLLANIILVSKMYPKTLIVFGFSGMFYEEKDKLKFTNLLDFHNVNYIDEYYVKWARDHKLPFHADREHPRPKAGEKFVSLVIIPKLKELEWI